MTVQGATNEFRRWSPAEDQRVRARYPLEGSTRLADDLGRSVKAVQQRARFLGIGAIPKIPMAGRRFGSLLVVSEAAPDKRGAIRWTCVCDCGRSETKDGFSLRQGATSRCHLCARPALTDLAGQRFGRLTAIALDGEPGSGPACWICECDCGQFTSVKGNKLKNGNTRSCGCGRNSLRWTHKRLEFRGQSKFLAAWCRELGISYSMAVWRLLRGGWSVERVLTTPLRPPARSSDRKAA